MTDFDFKKFLQTVPDTPGVYQMLAVSGDVIYVGKAKSLKARLNNYYTYSRSESAVVSKTHIMVKNIYDIRLTLTATEQDALLLENTLIKKFKPKYNILLRDDKSYPCVYLGSKNTPFPRIDVVRGSARGQKQTDKSKSNLSKVNREYYFGPYVHKRAARLALSSLSKVFGLRTCTDTVFNNRSRPCLQYQIKRCLGPCVGLVSKTDYEKAVAESIDFLNGQGHKLTKQLISEMEESSEQQDYDKAAILRDKIYELKKLMDDQIVEVAQNIKSSYDIIDYRCIDGFLWFSLIFVREGRVVGSFKNKFSKLDGDFNEGDAVRQWLVQYYTSSRPFYGLPSIICLKEKLADSAIISNYLSKATQKPISITGISKKISQQWLAMASENLNQAIAQWRQDDKNLSEKWLDLTVQLQLIMPSLVSIERLECYDISHLQGEETFGSCVVFDMQGPAKSFYRRYRIKNAAAGDDYAALAEMLFRRFESSKSRDSKSLPDLIIIDGGVGQLNRVAEVLADLAAMPLCLIGISKGPERRLGEEKIYLYEYGQWTLSSSTKAFHLLQHARDEAHRFALTGHRQGRAKKRLTSTLEDIEGVGAKRRHALLNHLGGWQGVKEASVERLMSVPGISKSLAEKIYSHLHS